MSWSRDGWGKLYAGLLIVAVFCAFSFPLPVSASIKKVVVLIDTAVTSWTVPGDWNSYDNIVEAIGGGGGGVDGAANGSGSGGGGAYAKIMNLPLTAGATVTYQVGAGGSAQATNGNPGKASIFNGSGSACASQSLCAQPGYGEWSMAEVGGRQRARVLACSSIEVETAVLAIRRTTQAVVAVPVAH